MRSLQYFFNGVKVGFVKKIQLNYKNPKEVILLLAIEQSIPVTVSTYATLKAQGITGSYYVGLAAKNSMLQAIAKSPTAPYPIIPYKGSLLDQLDKAIKTVTKNIDNVSKNLSEVFTAENNDHLKNALKNIDIFTKSLKSNSDNFNTIIDNTAKVSQQLAKVSEAFPRVVKNIDTGVRRFNTFADTTSRSVVSTMSTGKATLNQFSQEVVPNINKFMARMNELIANLELVAEKMRQNPAVIIRGNTPSQPGPGEK